MGPKIYINGELLPRDQAKVSVYDHGLLYGDGVFEGIRVYNGKVFRLQAHLGRLYNSAKAILLDIPMSQQEMAAAMEETIEANEARYPYIRLVVTRGVGTLGLDPYKCAEPQVVIIYDEIALYPPEMYEHGLEIMTAATRQKAQDNLSPRIKSLNYLGNIMAKIECVRAGLPEALMLNRVGHVTECTGDNIFIVKDGVVITPPPGAGILKGVTRGVIFEIGDDLCVPVREENLTLFDLYAADECFLTGTAAEIISVVKIDGRTVGDGKPGRMTRRLLERFRELTEAG